MMQSAITLPVRAVTAPPVPAICRHCGASQQPQETPIETTWENALIMLSVAVFSLTAGVAAAAWLAASGFLSWLG